MAKKKSVPKKAPKLKTKQLIVMQAIATQSLMNPEFAADVFVNPRDKLLGYNLSEKDVENIADYFNYVKSLIDEDVKADWY
jgi:hypothetical protein